jgi:hypothetical protein
LSHKHKHKHKHKDKDRHEREQENSSEQVILALSKAIKLLSEHLAECPEHRHKKEHDKCDD